MAEIQFTEATKPDKISRVENPYTTAVNGLVGTERALAFTVDAPAGCVKGNEDPAVLRARRQLTEAGNAAGVTVRTLYKDAGKGKVQVTFWAVAKITRNPKDETPAPAVTPAKPAAKPAARKATRTK